MNKKLLLLSLLLVAGCGDHPPMPPVAAVPAVTNYDGHGIIQQIAPDRRTVTIKHDAIADYMPAMTMDFTVKDTNEVAGLGANDEVNFKLAVTETNDWIEGVRFVAHHVGEVTNALFIFHESTPELKPGDALPDYDFTAEDGRTIHFSDYRGKAVAFTFFFSSCPLPDFCPKMNRNFEAARKLLMADTNAPANWQMMSISFDPDFDKPALLAAYGNFYRENDTNRWVFAVASTNTLAGLSPKVDLRFWRENGTISHNLRTVVLDANGKIFNQFDGNDWTAEELAGAIEKAAGVR